jgi:Predicted membrane protein
VAIGAAFRLAGLGSSRLSYDESFTAMAGRLPIGSLTPFLARNDSHPPLDYLLRLPLARAGVSEFWFRLPSVVCSIGALALFAWWVRSWGRVGIIATGLMAFSAFQITHGRQARMYAELELIGVVVAMLALAWVRRPNRRVAAMLGVVVFLGLLTHVSMFLVAAGLFTIAGRRTDREAWWWRGAIGAAGLGWAALWGSTFLTQAAGGHSGWIPRTSPATLVTALGRLVTFAPFMSLIVVGATILGGAILRRRDQDFSRVWIACFAIPVVLAALAGLAEPVVLDRTFTLMSWAPLLAVAFVLDALLRRSVAIGAVAVAAALLTMVPAAFGAMEKVTGPNAPLRALEQRIRPGDIVAVRPLSKAPELQWSVGVRHQSSVKQVAVPGDPRAFGLQFRGDDPSGRLVLLDWRRRSPQGSPTVTSCGHGWSWGHTHISCTSITKGLDHDVKHGA